MIATRALADQVVIQRNVTVREEPNRASGIVTFPPIGSALRLNSAGRVRGYYPVELEDGRQGWVYFTFVRRLPGEPPWASAALTEPSLAVHYIDVDQGAAALIETPCGVVMIDAGGRSAADGDHLVAYLQGVFARRTDLDGRIAAIFVTHTHIDHNRFLHRVAEAFPVGGYIHNGRPNGSGRSPAKWMLDHAAGDLSINVQSVSETEMASAPVDGLGGDVIDPLDCPTVDPKIRVLSGQYVVNPGWPDGEFDNGNNHSLVIRIDYGEASFLFTGDLEEAALDTLVEKYDLSDQLNVDVYAVGHHGSYNGTTHAQMLEMSPKMAVISMGKPSAQAQWTAWAYGHPRRAAVNELVQNLSGTRTPRSVMIADGAKRFSTVTVSRALFATGWDGDVVVRASPDGGLAVDVAR
jgi:competence protein ComEC